jgi:hypothetical protein
MKSYLLLFLFFVCFFSNQIFSQFDYRKGYYTNNNGDTIYGLIDYKSDIANSKECRFKQNENADEVVFLPGQICSYRFLEDKYYVSKKIKDNDSENYLFLECLLKGKATIYYYRSSKKDKYFIEKDGVIGELTNDEGVIYDSNGAVGTRNSNKFKGYLKNSFQDCPKLFTKIDHTDFNKKSLIKISKEYHDLVCSEEKCIIYTKKIPKIVTHYGLFCYYAFPQFLDPKSLNLYSDKIQTFCAGSTIEVGMPDINRNVSGQISMGYGFTKSKYQHRSPNIIYDLIYDFSFFRTEINLLYDLPFRKIKSFFSFGIPFNITLKSKEYYQFDDKLYMMENYRIYTDYLIQKKILGFNLGLGMEYKIFKILNYQIRINYEYNMESGNNVNPYGTKGFLINTCILF